MLNDKFEVDGETAVFSTWRVEGEGPFDVDDIEITDSMHARAGVTRSRMTDERAVRLLAALTECEFLLKLVSGTKTTGLSKTNLTRSVPTGRRARYH